MDFPQHNLALSLEPGQTHSPPECAYFTPISFFMRRPRFRRGSGGSGGAPGESVAEAGLGHRFLAIVFLHSQVSTEMDYSHEKNL